MRIRRQGGHLCEQFLWLMDQWLQDSEGILPEQVLGPDLVYETWVVIEYSGTKATQLSIRNVSLKLEGIPGLKRRCSILNRWRNSHSQAGSCCYCSIRKEVPVLDLFYELSNYKIHAMNCCLRITFLKRIVLKKTVEVDISVLAIVVFFIVVTI